MINILLSSCKYCRNRIPIGPRGNVAEPDIYLLGIRIVDPAASATDIAVALLCLFAFTSSALRGRPGEIFRHLRWYFLFMSVGTLLGGVIGHAFIYALGHMFKLPGWIASMVGVYFMERASLSHSAGLVSETTRRILSTVNLLTLFLSVAFTLATLEFFYVQIHTVYGLALVVLGLESLVFSRTRDRGSLWIMTAIATAAVAALLFNLRFMLSPVLSYQAISHVFIGFSIYFFYLGARNMAAATGGAPASAAPADELTATAIEEL